MVHRTWENCKQFATTSLLRRQKAFQLTFRTEAFQPRFPLLDADLDFFYCGIWTFLSSLNWALWPITAVIRIVTIFNLSLIIRCLLQYHYFGMTHFGERKRQSPLLWRYKGSVLQPLPLPPEVSLLFLCWLSFTTDLSSASLISSDFSELSWVSLVAYPLVSSIYWQVFLPVHLFREESKIAPNICF